MNNTAAPPRLRSTCPHDCPSTCALEVEKLDDQTIGRIYGADNSYTQGVVCAKVARYAERIHHPDRLSQPLIRTNRKSAHGQFEAIAWDDALDCVAERLSSIISEYGAEAVWPYHYAGTMGLVQREVLTVYAIVCVALNNTLLSVPPLPMQAGMLVWVQSTDQIRV